MTIEQTVEIPADGRLTFEIPPQKPASRARVIIQFPVGEDAQKIPTGGAVSHEAKEWVNPLFGLAKAKGATLTLDRFMEIQQEEIIPCNKYFFCETLFPNQAKTLFTLRTCAIGTVVEKCKQKRQF